MTRDSKSSQLLLFPLVNGLLILRPGESAFVDCELRPDVHPSETLSEGTGSALLLVQSAESTPLILHPAMIFPGERIGVRLSNPSRYVCVIASDEADISKRLGHGIFRSSAVIPTNRPIARAVPIALRGEKGECAS